MGLAFTDVVVAIGIVGALYPLWTAVREYRLRAQSQRAESDINLARLFADLAPIAHGRTGVVFSEAAAEHIVAELPAGTPVAEIRTRLRDGAAVALPVGAGMQVSAIISIGDLGARYVSLREPARQMLQSMTWVADPSVDPAIQRARQTAQVRIEETSVPRWRSWLAGRILGEPIR